MSRWRKRETLYGEFIGECSRLLVDALTHTLDKLRDLAARLRADQSHPALRFARGSREAERLLRRITDQYFSNNLTIENMRSIGAPTMPIRCSPSAKRAAPSSGRCVRAPDRADRTTTEVTLH